MCISVIEPASYIIGFCGFKSVSHMKAQEVVRSRLTKFFMSLD